MTADAWDDMTPEQVDGMTGAAYWSSWCPGQVMCCICFECKDKAELATDTDGMTWDVCSGQCAVEAGIVEAVDIAPPTV